MLTIGAILVIMHHFKQPESLVGVWMGFAAAVFYAAAIVTYEHLFAHFHAVSLMFFRSLFTGCDYKFYTDAERLAPHHTTS